MSHDVVRKNDLVSSGPHLVTQNEVIRVIVGSRPNSADGLERIAANSHGRTHCEAHAFHHVGDQNPGWHFHRHAECLQYRPEVCRRNSRIRAGHESDRWIQERRDYIAHAVGGCLHLAVTNYKVGTGGSPQPFLQRTEFGAGASWWVGGEHATLYARARSGKLL